MRTKRTLKASLFALLFVPFLALAQGGIINAYQTVDLNAAPRDVWDAIKTFDGLAGWHPVFSEAVLLDGENGTPGAMRRLTVKDGPSFDEELLELDEAQMKLRYKIIGENELPIDNYDATIQVVRTGRGRSSVLWRGSFTAKPGNKDEDMIKFIEGVYRAGLDNLKQMFQ
ncbi:MAG: SRPBCC family protein [Burkholderiales bacterium]